MARRNSNGRFVIEKPEPELDGQTPVPEEKSPAVAPASVFTGLDPFTSELVARAPRVEPAQPTIIPAAKPAPTNPAPAEPNKQPTPLLVGGIGAILGLGMAALVKRGLGG